MAYPPAYEREFSFSEWETLHPGEPKPGASLDTEFDNVSVALTGTQDALALIQRSDGALANDSVGEDQLQADVFAGIADGITADAEAAAAAAAASAAAAATSATNAAASAGAASTSQAAAAGSAALAGTSQSIAQDAANEAALSATDADDAATAAEIAANETAGSVAETQAAVDLAFKWAEYLAGPVMPAPDGWPEAVDDGMWSAKWWALKARDASQLTQVDFGAAAGADIGEAYDNWGGTLPPGNVIATWNGDEYWLVDPANPSDPASWVKLTGDTGATGATGPANSLAIGTVTTLPPGSPATATITGTPPSQTLSLGIPQGATGSGGSGAGGNPTALIGLTPVNGVATTLIRSDGAPALSQAIAPTWTAQHIFANAGRGFIVQSATPDVYMNETGAATDEKLWRKVVSGGTLFYGTRTDVDGTGATYLAIDRTGTVVDSIALASTALTHNGSAIPTAAATPTWTGAHTFTAAGTAPPAITLSSSQPVLVFEETDAAADNRRWLLSADGEQFRMSVRNDANSVAANWLVIDRTGTVVDSVAFAAGAYLLTNPGTAFVGFTAADVATLQSTGFIWGSGGAHSLHAQGRMHLERLNATPVIAITRVNGTYATMTPLVDTDIFGQFSFSGAISATATAASAYFLATATGNWSATSAPARLDVFVCAAGTTTPTNVARFAGDSVTFPVQVVYSKTGTLGANGSSVKISGAPPYFEMQHTGAPANQGRWINNLTSTNWQLFATDDAGTVASVAIRAQRSGSAISLVEFGNATDNPTFNFAGTGALTVPGRATFTNQFAAVVNGASINIATSGLPSIALDETSQTTGNRRWMIYSTAGAFNIAAMSDSSGAGSDFFTVTRSGTAATTITLNVLGAVSPRIAIGTSPFVKLNGTSDACFFFHGATEDIYIRPGTVGGSIHLGVTGNVAVNVNAPLVCNYVVTAPLIKRDATYQIGWAADNGTLSFGSIYVTGAKNGYHGIAVGDGGPRPTLMADGTNAGVYSQGDGKWLAKRTNSTQMTVDYTINAPAFVVTSSRAIKRETGKPSRVADILAKLRPILYRLLDGDSTEQLGMIAEEVHEVCPQLSNGKSISYDRLAVLLLADWQESHGVAYG